jgi:nicotinate phosphoribosyltransferase
VPAGASALLVDLYQLTMGQAYFDAELADREATFDLFFRRLPGGWGYLLAAGLGSVADYLDELSFTDDDLDHLDGTGRFSSAFLGHLQRLQFTGDVRAMPEGTPFFPGEPVLELEAPVIEAQLAETMVLNLVHFQSLVAGKAARSVDVARGTTLVDFGMRRTHGADASLLAARSSYLAGFDATSNVLAGREYRIPTAGTMAHSFVESFADELEAFRSFARSYPHDTILLVDTYETEEGTRKAAEVGRELERRGSRLRGIRLDSGDLLDLSRRAREILDEAGLADVAIFASGGLDEHDVERLLTAGAPIGGFGIGSRLGTSADAPYLDMAYKLVELDGRPTLKLSPGKATLPGRKQVWRVAEEGLFSRDVVERDETDGPEGGEPLLKPLARATLADARERAAAERRRLPARHRTLAAAPYEVAVGPELEALRDDVARRRRG